MKKIFLAFFLICLTGCKPGAEKAIDLVKKEISSDMRDPESTKFRYMRFIEKEEKKDGTVYGIVCGQVNSKNGFGAYTGNSPIMVFISMTPNGVFYTGVTYTVYKKEIYQTAKEFDPDAYYSVCGDDE